MEQNTVESVREMDVAGRFACFTQPCIKNHTTKHEMIYLDSIGENHHWFVKGKDDPNKLKIKVYLLGKYLKTNAKRKNWGELNGTLIMARAEFLFNEYSKQLKEKPT